jgi:hypothetical protein
VKALFAQLNFLSLTRLGELSEVLVEECTLHQHTLSRSGHVHAVELVFGQRYAILSHWLSHSYRRHSSF